MTTLVVVPARGGSRGIVRKNLQDVGGVPLFLRAARFANLIPSSHVVIATDDREIAELSRAHGLDVMMRDAVSDEQTLQELVDEVWQGMRETFTHLALVLPTSPLLDESVIRDALFYLAQPGVDSVGLGEPNQHIMWFEGQLLRERVNRQAYDPTDLMREVGGLFITSKPPDLITARHYIMAVDGDCSLDVDTWQDLATARMRADRRNILFSTAAGKSLGTGHFRRCIALAERLAPFHDVRFVTYMPTPATYDELARRGWLVPADDWTADVIVHDHLDVPTRQIMHEQAAGSKVMCLEDSGRGARWADLVVNELYPHDHENPHVKTGPAYAVLRPEFQGWNVPDSFDVVRKVMISFGGTDPASYGEKLAALLAPFYPNVRVLNGDFDGSVAASFRWADLVITSAGRTPHEVAAVGRPVIAIPVNEREARHVHAPGVFKMRPRWELSLDQVLNFISFVANDAELRYDHVIQARRAVDGLGTARICHEIVGLLLEAEPWSGLP